MVEHWLWVSDDFYDRDWLMDALPDCGIFCKDYCDTNVLFLRFEDYDWTDCSNCGFKGRNYPIVADKKWKCKKCKKQFTVTSGTYLSDSKLEYHYWYRTAYLLGKLRVPINSHWLSRELGITQKTTYSMLTTIKRALQVEGSGIKYKIPEKIDDYKIMLSLLKNTKL